MLNILFVCTGNRCRSPFAEASFRRFCKSDWINVSSAGTLEFEGLRPPSEMIRAGELYGIDLAGYRSRYLANASPEDADLVLGMSLEHISIAAVQREADPVKSFTLLEFLRLASLAGKGAAANESEARALVAKAHGLRAEGSLFSASDEIRDPMGGPESGYIAVARRIDEACRDLAALLCAAG